VTRRDRGRWVGAVLAAAWLAVVLLVDLLTAPDALVLSVLYAISPLIACSVLPTVPTAGFAVAAVALAVGSNAWGGQWETAQMWVRVIDVALVSTAAVAVAEVRVRRERRLARVERIAEVAQRTILPVIPTRVGSVTTGARYLSATEDTLVGGDLFDWFHSDQRICFLVGDVRGKGLGAVEQAARVIRAFRQSAAAGGDLATIAAQMSTYLMPFLDEEEFATAALIQLTDTSHVTLVDCGHPPPLLVPRDGEPAFMEAPVGLPLGLGADYEPATWSWSPGDRVLLYTDGLSEARDGDDEFLPLLPLAPALRSADVEEALDALLDDVRRYVPAARLADDLAVLLLENTGVEEAAAGDTGGGRWMVSGASRRAVQGHLTPDG
jgi:serine phosphatase RsbU (regulator of sigma subunit)